jgi:translocation and assembly module TamB
MSEQNGHIPEAQQKERTAPDTRKKPRKHLIKPTWLRRTLKVLLGFFVCILLLPVLVYIPFVQDFLKDVACDVASEKTGMKISAERFRLRWPLDVEMDGVLVITRTGDTIVQARSLVADVKLLPLLHMDAQIKKMRLLEGRYLMVSEDSSLTMRIMAGELELEGGSDINLKQSLIALRDPRLKDADVSLQMNVWKSKPDSVPSPPAQWVITANRLLLDNVRFRMSMPPTVKDLDLTVGKGSLDGAVIDLKRHDISAASVKIAGGKARYVVPTARYIATHPAPIDTISPPSPPYTIRLGKAHLAFESAFYGVDGATPQPGFDPSFIEASDVEISLQDFYNRASTLRLPITALRAKERSGLAITSGTGEIAIDSLGLKFSDIDIATTRSRLTGNALVSYELMALDPDAPVSLDLSGSLGWDDLYAYMPTLKPMLSVFPHGNPIVFDIAATGTVSDVVLKRFSLSIHRFLSLKADGHVANPMNPQKTDASLNLNGSLQDAGVMNRMFGKQLAAMGIKVPAFSIKGHVAAKGRSYKADLSLKSSAGDASLNGSLSLTAERYDVDATLRRFNLGAIMPSLGLGTITGTLTANGAGFNPTVKGAGTHIDADASTLVYGGNNLAPLSLKATLAGQKYDIDLQGSNPMLDLSLMAKGTLAGNDLSTDMTADLRHVDLHALGFIDVPCQGAASFDLSGSANLESYHCDLTGGLYDLDWNYADKLYAIPSAFDFDFLSNAAQTGLSLYGDGLNLDFHAASSLRRLTASLPRIMALVARQVDSKQLDMNVISDELPLFTLDLDVDSQGLASHFLEGTGYKFDSLHMALANDSTISGDMKLTGAGNSSLTLDTVTLGLNQRGQMLNYNLHIGNTKENLPAFASVDISGYAGSNRASAFLRQRDSEHKEGYRLGFTAAFLDSVVNLHLTPLNATIAYKPWSVNDDNYIQIGPGKRIQADMTASSGTSSVRLSTPQRTDSLQALQVNIKDLHIEDLLQMNVLAPPITGTVNSDLTLVYRGNAVTGKGYLGVHDLAYDRQRIGDLDFDVQAGMGFTGNTGGKIGMLLDGREVAVFRGYMFNDTIKRQNVKDPTAFELELKEFPLAVANPFLSQEYMQLTGALNGKIKMNGEFSAPLLNGALECDSVGIRIPVASSTLYFQKDNPIVIENNVLRFNDFRLYGMNRKPITVTGKVDASSISDIAIDLSMDGREVALVDNRRRTDEIYGKLFIDLSASARGPLSRLDINADLSVRPATDIYYTYSSADASIQQGNTTDVVRFVRFADSTLNVTADSVQKYTPMNMRIDASLGIINGAKATINLSANGTDKVTLSPYGNLSYTQNYMGDMRLNGTLYLGKGFARYSVPMIGEKTFDFDAGSYVNWSGDLMNPALNIYATDRVKANVQQEGANSRLIYFDVGLSVLGTLSAPKVAFDLSTDDDMTVQNELLSMSADQRQASAMNLLLYNTYTGPGVKANANLSNPLYSFLEGQLNSWAAKNIRGVDLSFGIDQYKQTVNGQNDNTTSYSYQVSKSLFDNRFKIIVGGNYSTDAQADENFAQNLISDISFEYSVKQSENLNMYVRLFRHTGFESILEGEVTETGVGFVMRRKLSSLRSLFRFRHKRRNKPADNDSTPTAAPDSLLVPLSRDSIIITEEHVRKR